VGVKLNIQAKVVTKTEVCKNGDWMTKRTAPSSAFLYAFFENGIRAITEVDDETQLPCLGKMFFFCGCVYLFVAKPSFIQKGTS
jgi:hypothetical protein